MDIRPIVDAAELTALAQLAAPLQSRPESHIAYLGLERDGIADELAASTWRDVSAVAAIDDSIVGWLVGDVDPEMGRVWWFGPFVVGGDFATVATGLLTTCRRRMPAGIREEELAVDARFGPCRTWAVTEGFTEEEGSFVFVLEASLGSSTSAVREIAAADHDAVVQLHDELFPGTHTTGADLVAGHDATHRRLVVERHGEVVGYIAVERQADGSGYIDYVGVASTARRTGLGGELVRAGVAELRSLGSRSISLTVREGNRGARDLYTSLGFDEERVLVPMRRGFSLA
jgi:ribosomal protein S18 acetylase RimI-like enzyme